MSGERSNAGDALVATRVDVTMPRSGAAVKDELRQALSALAHTLSIRIPARPDRRGATTHATLGRALRGSGRARGGTPLEFASRATAAVAARRIVRTPV